jgi:hypothetical protein
LPREWPWAAPRGSHPSRPGGNAQADIHEMSSTAHIGLAPCKILFHE